MRQVQRQETRPLPVLVAQQSLLCQHRLHLSPQLKQRQQIPKVLVMMTSSMKGVCRHLRLQRPVLLHVHRLFVFKARSLFPLVQALSLANTTAGVSRKALPNLHLSSSRPLI